MREPYYPDEQEAQKAPVETSSLLRSQLDSLQESPTEPWMASYADMVTLLLGFFVMLLSISSINMNKYEQVAHSMSGAIGKQPKPKVDLEQLHQEIANFVESQALSSKIQAKKTALGVSVSVEGAYLFDSGSARLSPRAVPVIRQLSSFVSKVPYNVAVEGHTDDVPINSQQFSSNWELSSARASGIVRFFISEGIAPLRLQATGFADTRPLAPNLNPKTGKPMSKNRDRNRRVVIQFLAF